MLQGRAKELSDLFAAPDFTEDYQDLVGYVLSNEVYTKTVNLLFDLDVITVDTVESGLFLGL